jgi:hypothetical protein
MLYKAAQTETKLEPEKMRGLQWFSLKPNYGGDTYGGHKAKYSIMKRLRLFDLGSMKARQRLIHDHPQLTELLVPDFQYSGSAANLKTHRALRKVLRGYDGTYIDRANAPAEHQLAGPSEVVLWGKFATLLTRIN